MKDLVWVQGRRDPDHREPGWEGGGASLSGACSQPPLHTSAGLPGHGGGQGHRWGERTPRGRGAHGKSPSHLPAPQEWGGREQM